MVDLSHTSLTRGCFPVTVVTQIDVFGLFTSTCSWCQAAIFIQPVKLTQASLTSEPLFIILCTSGTVVEPIPTVFTVAFLGLILVWATSMTSSLIIVWEHLMTILVRAAVTPHNFINHVIVTCVAPVDG